MNDSDLFFDQLSVKITIVRVLSACVKRPSLYTYLGWYQLLGSGKSVYLVLKESV